MKKINYQFRYIVIVVLCTLAVVGSSCKKNFVAKDMIMMTGTSTDPEVKFVVENLPSSYAVSVTATDKVKQDVNITLAVDNSLIDTYNRKTGATYYELPANAYTMQSSNTVIKAGTSISDPVAVNMVGINQLEVGKVYLIPVTIKSTDGNMEVLEASRTIYLRIARVLQFNSVDLSNVTMNYQYILNNPIASLPVYSWEIKFYAYGWKSATASEANRISRLAGFGGTAASVAGLAGGCDQNMLRFGEGTGSAPNQLQVCTKQAKFYSKTIFQTEKWYTLSIVNDGTTLSLYVDGVLDNSTTVTPYVYTMYGYQLGMTESGYTTTQKFNGRIGEMRVWGKVLTASEIKNGICGVFASSKDLLGYWKMNEGAGLIFNDVSGSDRNMVSVKTVPWNVDDANNKCIE